PPGILRRTSNSRVLLAATGPLISPAFSGLLWEQHSIPVQRKDRIVLFTDGVIETESESGMYGLERLIDHRVNNNVPADVLLDGIVQSVYQFAAGRPIHDDLTLVAAEL